MSTPMTPKDFDYTEILNCMRCGFCLPTCPTHILTGLETSSPRGRIALMKAAADGLLTLDQIAPQMDECLGCRNCETACPSGVKFGGLLEDAREAVAQTRPKTVVAKLMFNVVFPNLWTFKLLGAGLWFYQASAIQKLVEGANLDRILPPQLRAMGRVTPRVRAPWRRKHTVKPGPAPAPNRPKVGMFLGCIMDVVFWETNQHTIDLLTKAGYDVVLVKGQACCGALHAHAGEKEGARALAKENIDAFLNAGVDYVVNNAGGCGAALREYHHWFRGDPAWAPKATDFAHRVRDFSELIAMQPVPRLRTLGGERITMQESCHLAHGQGVRTQPRQVIRQVPGIVFTELAEPDGCCGSAGIYNLTQPKMSLQVLDRKMEQVKESGATTVITTNPGCLLQMRLGIERAGLSGRVRAIHLVDLLAEAAT